MTSQGALKEKKNNFYSKVEDEQISDMFEVGAHFGYRHSKTHPSVENYIFGVKNNTEVFDLEKTRGLLDKAKDFVEQLGREGKTVIFVGGKHPSWAPVEENANKVGAPYVVGRWIGGTITNFPQTKKRLDHLKNLREQRESGEFAKKYTKKEQLLIDREIGDLEEKFGGIVNIEKIPEALFVIDPRKEHLAIREAQKKDIPVVALASSDCDIEKIDYPIVANDSAPASIRYFTEQIAEAYNKGKKEII